MCCYHVGTRIGLFHLAALLVQTIDGGKVSRRFMSWSCDERNIE